MIFRRLYPDIPLSEQPLTEIKPSQHLKTEKPLSELRLDSLMNLADSQSEWVTEKLVMSARDRGIPISIYRHLLFLGIVRQAIGLKMT